MFTVWAETVAVAVTNRTPPRTNLDKVLFLKSPIICSNAPEVRVTRTDTLVLRLHTPVTYLITFVKQTDLVAVGGPKWCLSGLPDYPSAASEVLCSNNN